MGRMWAVVRIGLGLAQVMGATVILYALVQTGISALTIGATVVTLGFIVLSKLLFGRQDRKD